MIRARPRVVSVRRAIEHNPVHIVQQVNVMPSTIKWRIERTCDLIYDRKNQFVFNDMRSCYIYTESRY